MWTNAEVTLKTHSASIAKNSTPTTHVHRTWDPPWESGLLSKQKCSCMPFLPFHVPWQTFWIDRIGPILQEKKTFLYWRSLIEVSTVDYISRRSNFQPKMSGSWYHSLVFTHPYDPIYGQHCCDGYVTIGCNGVMTSEGPLYSVCFSHSMLP